MHDLYRPFGSDRWLCPQVAVIKRQLQLCLPGVRVFLDVDDLVDISALETYIAQSALRVVETILYILVRIRVQSFNSLVETIIYILVRIRVQSFKRVLFSSRQNNDKEHGIVQYLNGMRYMCTRPLLSQALVLIFLSKGYMRSRNCLREV